MDNLVRTIVEDKTSYQLLWFLALNLTFAFVELAYGIWANSLGLISDSFHMFFDCSALLGGLVASIISQWEANELFSFGYVRAEILAGFVNGMCLLFVGFFIFSEAVKRALDPPEVRPENLFAVAVAGFIVNVIGMVVFHHGHSHDPAGRSLPPGQMYSDFEGRPQLVDSYDMLAGKVTVLLGKGSVCASRMSMSRRHSVIFTGLDHRRASQVPSAYDSSTADHGHSESSSSPGSSQHEDTNQEPVDRTFTRKTSKDPYTYRDEEPGFRKTSDPASDPLPPDYPNTSDPASDPLAPDYSNASDPASDPLPPDYPNTSEPASDPLPPDYRNVSDPVSNPLAPNFRNVSDPAGDPTPADYKNTSDPASDPTPADYTDQEGSQRDTSHVATNQGATASCVRDCSHREQSLGCMIKAPPDVRRTTSGSNKRVVTVNTQGNQQIYSTTTAPSSSSEIVQGVYLHIMADALGSIGVILSSTLINQFGWVIADPICSMFISALVILSVFPLLQESMGILMQRTPIALDEVLPQCYDRVSSIEGVCSIQQPHFWTLCTDVYVGALKLEVEPEADSQDILHRTRIIFYEVGVKHLYVQIEEAATSM